MHVRDLVGMGHHFLPSEPTKWNVEDVYEFIRSLPGKAPGSRARLGERPPPGTEGEPTLPPPGNDSVTRVWEQPCRHDSVRSLPRRAYVLLQDAAVKNTHGRDAWLFLAQQGSA